MTENEEARFEIIRQLNDLETRLNQVASDMVEVSRRLATQENITKVEHMTMAKVLEALEVMAGMQETQK